MTEIVYVGILGFSYALARPAQSPVYESHAMK